MNMYVRSDRREAVRSSVAQFLVGQQERLKRWAFNFLGYDWIVAILQSLEACVNVLVPARKHRGPAAAEDNWYDVLIENVPPDDDLRLKRSWHPTSPGIWHESEAEIGPSSALDRSATSLAG